jgi:hypothetical protein
MKTHRVFITRGNILKAGEARYSKKKLLPQGRNKNGREAVQKERLDSLTC